MNHTSDIAFHLFKNRLLLFYHSKSGTVGLVVKNSCCFLLLSHIFISKCDVLYDCVSCPMHDHIPCKLLVGDNAGIFAKHSTPAVNTCCCSSKHGMLTFAQNVEAFSMFLCCIIALVQITFCKFFITLLYRIGHIS